MRNLLAVVVCIWPLLLGACASKPKLIPEVESAALASDGVSIRYRIAGQIDTTQRDSNYDVEYESSLNPAPGLPGVLR